VTGELKILSRSAVQILLQVVIVKKNNKRQHCEHKTEKNAPHNYTVNDTISLFDMNSYRPQ